MHKLARPRPPLRLASIHPDAALASAGAHLIASGRGRCSGTFAAASILMPIRPFGPTCTGTIIPPPMQRFDASSTESPTPLRWALPTSPPPDSPKPWFRLRTPGPTRAGARLAKVFFSDDGSTALEVALKLASEFARRTSRSDQPRFLSLAGAYHGDTWGRSASATSRCFAGPMRLCCLETDSVAAPYCYRCPFNRASRNGPTPASTGDAGGMRGQVEQRSSGKPERPPLCGDRGRARHPGRRRHDCAAGRLAAPRGGPGARAWGLVVADEVLTGFGRALDLRDSECDSQLLFASHQEGVQPDFLALAKA